ncbi:MAG: PAS domain S-box protein [Steroidobacteraceae bacterium]
MLAPDSRPLTPAQIRLVTFILAPVTLLVLLAFTAARYTDTSLLADWLDNLHWTAAYVTAAALAWLGVRWADEQTRSARRWFAYGLTASALGQLVWDVQTALQHIPFPAPSDALFLCLGPCWVWGMLHAVRSHQARSIGWAFILDVITLGVVILAIVLALYLPRYDGPAGIDLALMVAYPISMLSCGCLALVLLLTLRLKLQYQWLTLIVASIINGILWMQWIYLAQGKGAQSSPLLYLLFSIVTLALGVGALLWRVESSTEPAYERRCEAVLRMLPLLVVGAAAVSVGLAWSLPGVPHVAAVAIYISAALVFILAAIRQSLLLFERDRLLAMEKHADELERTFQTLFHITRGGLALLDRHGRFLEINPSCSKLLGYDRAELLRMTIRDVCSEQTRWLAGHLGLVDQLGNGAFETECRCKDGHAIQVEMTNALIPDSGGQVFVIIRDITDSKRASEEMRLMTQRLAIATRTAGIGIWEYQPLSNTLVWDAHMHALYGVRPQEFHGHHEDWDQCIHPDDQTLMRQQFAIAMNQHRECHAEFRIIRPDGSVRHIEMRADVQLDAAGNVERIIGVNWDITARKQAETTHLRLEAQLRQSQKLEAIGTLASGIAHDFNNILGAILGNIELARQDIQAGHPALTSMEEIHKAGQRARELIRRLVAFGKPHELDFRATQLPAVIDDAMKLVRATLPATVQIHCQFTSTLSPVMIDSAQIVQVLLNLCTNAYQAMEQQKGRIDITLDQQEFTTANLPDADMREGRYVCLHIRDTGAGIDPAIADRIFEPFFTTKAVGEGSGLGLSIVHNIVRSHAGAIVVNSEPGQGTCFHIYLPAAMDAEHRSPQPPVIAGNTARGSGQHILYVDDEESLVFLTTRMLERFGYRVSGYTEATAALHAALADDADFDLVITDQSMPVMSGTELARTLLNERPHSRIVLVSGYLSPQEIERAYALGFHAVILKPDTVDELAATVHRLFSA